MSGMTDVVYGILDVHTANLLLQWSSAKGQGLAKGGIAKHFLLKQGRGEVVSIWTGLVLRTLVPPSNPPTPIIIN